MSADERVYRVESHNCSLGGLRVFGGETMTSWGARIPQPRYLTRAEAWAQAKKCMSADPDAVVKVYVFGRKVWSSRPCAY